MFNLIKVKKCEVRGGWFLVTTKKGNILGDWRQSNEDKKAERFKEEPEKIAPLKVGEEYAIEWEQLNCYKVLDIHPTSSPQEIRSAWKQASLKSHPDHGGSHDAQVKVNLAYEVLSDPISRQAHDIFWESIPSTSATSTPIGRSTSYRPNTPPYYQPRPQPQAGTKSTNNQTPSRKEPLVGLKSKIAQQVENEKKRIYKQAEKENRSASNYMLNLFLEKEKHAKSNS